MKSSQKECVIRNENEIENFKGIVEIFIKGIAKETGYPVKINVNYQSYEEGYVLYVDGGGNKFKDGLRGKAIIRAYDPQTGKRHTKEIQDSTNNEAELKAILWGFDFLMNELHKKKGLIYSDSRLAVSGISGKMDIKAGNLRPLLQEIWDIQPKGIEILWIPSKKQLAHKH